MKRWLLWGLAGLAVVLLGAWMFRPQPREVDVAVAQRGTMREYIEERGKTRLSRTYRVTMPLNGRIQDVLLDPGDRVVADEIVARMEKDDLQTELATAEKQSGQYEQFLEAMDHAIEAAANQTKGSEQQFEVADRQFKRQSRLAERDVTTEAELDAAELALVEARVDHLTNTLTEKALVAVRRAAVLMQEEANEKEARIRRDFGRAEILSPITGVVLERHVTNSRVLAQGEPLIDLGSWEDLEIEAEVLTRDAAAIQVGQLAEITASSFGNNPIVGTVTRIDPQAFTKVSSLGVEQQRVYVVIGFSQETLETLRTETQVGVGYRVMVKIITQSRENAVIIPRAAAFRDVGDRWVALVNRNGKLVRVELETGLENPYEIEVLTGIEAGDELVLAPDDTLEAGMEVTTNVIDTAGPGRSMSAE